MASAFAFAVGLGLVCLGITLIYSPGGLIAAGLSVVVVAVLHERGRMRAARVRAARRD